MGTEYVENAKARRLMHDVRRLGGAAAEGICGRDVPFTFTVPRANSAVFLSSAVGHFGVDLGSVLPVQHDVLHRVL